MPQRKKNQNKENYRAIKKTTLQQIHYTQQLRIPTLATMDLRQAGKSIELKKSSCKKPASRKTRCISVKQGGVQPPIRMKHLLRQFKSMKLIQDRSKSKSPRSSKSRPKTRKSTKKITQTQLNSKNSSEANLATKLQKTIKKIKEDHLFRDEDSQIPLVSTSQIYSEKEKKYKEVIFGDYFCEDINLNQLRYFCKTVDPSLRKSIQYFKGNIYDSMARKIQRAWRRYRTHKLVNRYANIFVNFSVSEEKSASRKSSEANSPSQVIISSDQLYPESMEERKVTYISNLEEDENEEIKEDDHQIEEDEQLKMIKLEQLQKWKQIIDLISKTKNGNPQQTQQLLKKLMSKSKINKMSLENSRRNSSGGGSSDSNDSNPLPQKQEDFCQNIEQAPNKKTRSLNSGDSFRNQQEDQFNSKKYIEYLDSDMYPIVENQNSSTTICKQKQQLLLKKLYEHPSRRLIHGSKILESGQESSLAKQIKSRLSHRSNSDFSIQSSQLDDQLNSDHSKGLKVESRRILRKGVKKSISEKILKHIESSEGGPETKNQYVTVLGQKQLSFQQIEIEKDSGEMKNALQELMRKQLEQYEAQSPQNEDDPSLDKCHSEEQLTKKLAELKKLREQDSDQEQKSEKESGLPPKLHRSSNPPLHKINIEDYDKNIESDEDIEQIEIGEKAEAITDLLLNVMVLEILRQMAKYPSTILALFKDFAVKKPKIRRAVSKSKKFGFPTNQAEIKQFIEHLCQYILSQEPNVFKNLEKATGPSALEMLRYMHQSADDQIYLDEEEDDPSVMVLPNWIFDNFWAKKLQNLKYERQGIDEEKEEQRQQYLKSLNKIFLRSCFDCLNECLDYERNFGSFGRPFPWKKSHLFEHAKNFEETEKSVLKAQKKLFQISATYCGIIIEKEQMLSLCGSQEYVTQVQEDRLSRMLAQDLVQGEDRWIFYDDEETQLLVECGNIIFYELLMEFYGELGVLSG